MFAVKNIAYIRVLMTVVNKIRSQKSSFYFTAVEITVIKLPKPQL